MFNIVGHRYRYFLLSLLVIVPGLISLLLPGGVKPAIDFTGGSYLELQFKNPTTPLQPGDVQNALAPLGFGDASVQTVGSDNTVAIRTKDIPNDVKVQIENALKARYGDFSELQFSSVGPAVGAEVTRQAAIAVLAAAGAILAYLWFAFRQVANPFRYGIAAIIAEIHDILVVLGVQSIFGRLFHWEMDALFLTALLTVIGFSVHDTIVVFDRIRENMLRRRGESFENVVNHSVIQTIDRSLNTSLTVIFTLSALVLFGGVTIRQFVLTLLIGIISGTYSSIFNASPILVVWENREWRNWFRRGAAPRSAAASR